MRFDMYALYRWLTISFGFLLSLLLLKRKISGKESHSRYLEKKSVTTKERPTGKLIWIHGASVGEAQSALILIDRIIKKFPNINILVTTGTLTSADLMAKKLPERAFHQFYPLDRPKWVNKFISHWKPNSVLWMESELWPNMLHEIKINNIPSALVNARLSPKSFRIWKKIPNFIKNMLSTFTKILCQTEDDNKKFDELGAVNTITTDNLKYSSEPLSYDDIKLEELRRAIKNRKIWLYSSTHEGEEEIAHELHKKLIKEYPDLLTIIVPRHPDRRDNIKNNCAHYNLHTSYRGSEANLPKDNDGVYIVDTLGELGLFYRLSPIAVIGRSLSKDGGGGHNPIEAAQLNCAVIHGNRIQNLQQIYDEMNMEEAAIKVDNSNELYNVLKALLDNDIVLKKAQNKALEFANKKTHVIDIVMEELNPVLCALNGGEEKENYAHKNP